MLIGHGSFDGKTGAFNLPGPDLTADDYATLLEKFTTQKVTFVNTASSSGAFIQPLAGPARTIVTATQDRRRAERDALRRVLRRGARHRGGRPRPQRPRLDAGSVRLRGAEGEGGLRAGGHILTEHATLDDGNQGKLAAMQYLAPERSRTAAAQAADPALRALLEQRDALERQVAELRLKKDTMDPARYDEELEKLLTDLALKTRAIRDMETKK